MIQKVKEAFFKRFLVIALSSFALMQTANSAEILSNSTLSTGSQDVAWNLMAALNLGNSRALRNVLRSANQASISYALGCVYLPKGQSIAHSPLQIAAATGNTEAVREILDFLSNNPVHLFSALQATTGGITALHLASANGNAEAASLLLDYAEKDFIGALFLLQSTDLGLNALHSAIQANQIPVIRILLESTFKDSFLAQPKTIVRIKKWKKKDVEVWKTLLEFSPQLAYYAFRLPVVGRVGQIEAAFYFRDAERTMELESLNLSFDHNLLMAMLSHNKELKEEDYMDFMRESNPVAYYLAYFGASLGSYIFKLVELIR